MALPIDAVYEIFGLLCRARVDVAQQPIQRERAAPDQVWRIFDGLWWHMILHDDHCSAAGALPNSPKMEFKELIEKSA